MLLELQISDFAIIDRLHLQLEPGFNVLTGETGAGKSIIIDALGMLRGDKGDPSFVRAGCSRARVEGIFTLAKRADLCEILREYGLWDEDDEQVILAREINAESGRSVARINGRAVSTGVLREIGGRLVDIHGQHEGIALFNIRTHLDLLDRYGHLVGLREEISQLVAQLQHVRSELEDLRRNETRRIERIEELRFLLEDVATAKLRVGEDAELLRERLLTQHSVRITDLVNRAYNLLYVGNESGRTRTHSVVEAFAAIADAITELAHLDETQAGLAEQANDLRYQAEDLALSVRTYRGSLDFDPARLEAIEDRLTVIRELQRKYNTTIEQILARAANAEAEIERLTNSAEYMAGLEEQETKLLTGIGTLALRLSQQRQAIGAALAHAVEGAMADLAMPYVKFQTQIVQSDDAHGVPFGAAKRRVACDRTGADQVEFMLSPNPGEPLKPLARIASGGESARLLLALKSILSRVDEVPTLVFDEIDVGVGGRAGQVVGQKLWAMTENHQVLCISHLSQVAAFADSHFSISKEIATGRTRTRVRLLNPEARVDEVAAMLDGMPSDHSRANAREIIERAEGVKARLRHETEPRPVDTNRSE